MLEAILDGPMRDRQRGSGHGGRRGSREEPLRKERVIVLCSSDDEAQGEGAKEGRKGGKARRASDPSGRDGEMREDEEEAWEREVHRGRGVEEDEEGDEELREQDAVLQLLEATCHDYQPVAVEVRCTRDHPVVIHPCKKH